MSDKEKVIEVIGKQHGIRLDDLWADSGIFIETLGKIIDELIKEEKIEMRRNGVFEYYYIV